MFVSVGNVKQFFRVNFYCFVYYQIVENIGRIKNWEIWFPKFSPLKFWSLWYPFAIVRPFAKPFSPPKSLNFKFTSILCHQCSLLYSITCPTLHVMLKSNALLRTCYNVYYIAENFWMVNHQSFETWIRNDTA